MAEFFSRDPLAPAFWDERFARGFTPWDRGGVPERLRAFVAASPALTTLIPGCGTGYELAYLCDAGWDATAIDFSPAAVASARAAVGQWGERVVEADFFAFTPQRALDCIYERAFLCAMPRALWPQVAARWAELLAPGKVLVGYFFFDENVKGPPFGIGRQALEALMAPWFVLEQDEAVSDSIAVFARRERWMVWRRM